MARTERSAPKRQQSATSHYQTFPTKPPTSRGKPPRPNVMRNDTSSSNGATPRDTDSHRESPLPMGQLCVLAVIALAEQTALNSFSPYLPKMAGSFPEVQEDQVGLYVGLIASSFALAQFTTNFFWGWLSDRIGRKPVVLMGTFFTACAFLAFGFCKKLWQAIVVQVFMGLVNGNQAIVSTCLGEITDKTNQSKAFTYLPVVYGIGGITGPVLGGLLAGKASGETKNYPYAAPNIVAAAILFADFIVTMIFLEESLDSAKEMAPLGVRVESLFSRLWQFTSSSTRPTYLNRGNSRDGHGQSSRTPLLAHDDENDGDTTDSGTEGSDEDEDENLNMRDVLTRDTILILATFSIFQLSNIAYNSLYPIFASASPPIGRGLSSSEIGNSLAFAGLVTIIFQVGLFGKLRDKIGNKVTYRTGLAGFVVAFALMPFIGYKSSGDGPTGLGSGKGWLWTELGVILVIKTVAAVGFLTSALLMITNTAPNHRMLGKLNGLAQTLSAAGRTIGPFISGSLFTASTKIRPKGEALAFGIFAGVAFVGFLLSFGIRGGKLEGGNADQKNNESEDTGSSNEDDEGEDGEEESHKPSKIHTNGAKRGN